MTSLPGTSLSKSIESEKLTDVFAATGDIALDAALDSGALDGVPVFGVLTRLYRAQRDVRQKLYFRKIVRFLQGLSSTSIEDRQKFTRQLTEEGKLEEFGETILLILDKVDDTRKPSIVGRVMAAHINGHLDFSRAMRLVAIVNRCYTADLDYLRSFQPGAQQSAPDIAASLFSYGLLATKGYNGGTFDYVESGGTEYDVNEYGKLLLRYALNCNENEE